MQELPLRGTFLGMIEIPLTQGQVALVDDDCAFLATLRWYAEKREQTYYATRNRPKIGKRQMGVVRMHHMVLPFLFGLEVDHINGNGLDNRRANLRLAQHRNNQRNRRRSQTKTSSKYKGVFRERAKHPRWFAQIWDPEAGKARRCGTYPTQVAAARAYDAAAKELYGEFARLNFPEDTTTAR